MSEAVAEANAVRRPAPIVTTDNEFFWAAAADRTGTSDGAGWRSFPQPAQLWPNPQFDYPVIAASSFSTRGSES